MSDVISTRIPYNRTTTHIICNSMPASELLSIRSSGPAGRPSKGKKKKDGTTRERGKIKLIGAGYGVVGATATTGTEREKRALK